MRTAESLKPTTAHYSIFRTIKSKKTSVISENNSIFVTK